MEIRSNDIEIDGLCGPRTFHEDGPGLHLYLASLDRKSNRERAPLLYDVDDVTNTILLLSRTYTTRMKPRVGLSGCLMACILLSVASQRSREPSEPGLARSGHPSALLCNEMCQHKPVVEKCQCPSEVRLPPNPCQSKKCRFGTRCVAFEKRPVCLPIPKACLLPPMIGLCTGKIIRYYFNYRSGLCEPFVYGGCSPNANNFRTMFECQKMCVHIQG
ncbi:uncharacterized protein [Haliotis asinina]|uniref:uncharacterized protein n=1 Tax=Haliotis asinina TaxID=109174 RepID=UPI003531B53C